MAPDYSIMFLAWFIGLFGVYPFGMGFFLGYLFVCSTLTQYAQFGAITVLLVVGIMYHELRKSVSD